MCGVPYHAAEGYIARLIQKGYRVAICDQMEDPRFAKKLVKREITRIVTPGTVTESSAAALAREQLPGRGRARRRPRRAGATSTFRPASFAPPNCDAAEVAAALEKLNVREVLVADGAHALRTGAGAADGSGSLGLHASTTPNARCASTSSC